MKLLMIEDNTAFSKALQTALSAYGFSVDLAANGTLGEEKAFIHEYDVILLDLNLPDMDGLQVLQAIRSHQDTPVLILSARDRVKDKASGLDIGADDYLAKPFEIEELRSRIHALIRRSHGRSHPMIQIGQLLIDPLSRKASYAGTAIAVTIKEFDILEYLATMSPKVVSSEELSEHLYDENFDPFSSVLRVHLARLKKKLAEAAGEELLINIRGKGYQLCQK